MMVVCDKQIVAETRLGIWVRQRQRDEVSHASVEEDGQDTVMAD